MTEDYPTVSEKAVMETYRMQLILNSRVGSQWALKS